MKKNLTEELKKIKEIMFERQLNEFDIRDIQNFLEKKIYGGTITFNDPEEESLDAILAGDSSDATANSLKSSLGDKKSDEMSDEEKRNLYAKATTDEDFYDAILFGINAPISEKNKNFLKYWRIAEMGTETSNRLKKTAVNNPLNTTQSNPNDPNMKKFNYVGVKHYSEPKYGIEATVKTLKNGYYDCIVQGLRKESEYKDFVGCLSADGKTPALNIWGTGKDHLISVINSIKNPNIARSIDKEYPKEM